MSVGGAERAIFQLIRAQRSAGVDADLLVSASPGYYGHQVSEMGAKVFEIGMRNGWDISVKNRFFDIIKNYTVLHFHGPAPALMYLSQAQGGCRLFYTHRAGAFNYPLKRLLSYKISGYFFRKSFVRISGNTKHAALVASRLFRIPLKKIPFTYNGIDFSLLKPKRSKQEVLLELGDLSKDVVRIGTTANIRKWKRIHYLLKAVGKLRSYPIHCYVIGDGPARKGLEKLSEDLGLTDIVTFTGQKKEVADYLNILDIFILPSNSGESFGNSAVEAMAVEIPTVVMRDGGGLVEHIIDGGGFIAESFSDIPIILRKLCESQTLCLRVGEKGKRYVMGKYTIDNMVNSYARFYCD